MNLNKILTLVIGLTVLAGLALHQGNGDGVGKTDESVLTGTALIRPANTGNAESGDGKEARVPGDSECPSMVAQANGEQIEECPPVAEYEQIESASSSGVKISQG